LERKARDSCRKCGSGETPQEQSDEEAPRTPAESEVPGVEINKHVYHSLFIKNNWIKKDFKKMGRIIKNRWRKVGECGTFLIESGGTGYVHG
jgi:hypothetical protein